MPVDVAVVIANHAGDDVLDACLSSVRAQTHLPAELTVVDAGPSRLGPRIAEAHGALVLPRPNRGLGYLYNEGARAARSELVLLLNNDVSLDRCCLVVHRYHDAERGPLRGRPGWCNAHGAGRPSSRYERDTSICERCGRCPRRSSVLSRVTRSSTSR